MTETIEVSDQEYRDRATRLANMLKLRPERHDQASFGYVQPENECGTAACVAGWAALESHGQVHIAADGVMTWPEPGTQRWYDDDAEKWVDVETVFDGTSGSDLEADGAKWLGLSSATADALFYTFHNGAAIELLRMIGDGRLPRDASPIAAFSAKNAAIAAVGG